MFLHLIQVEQHHLATAGGAVNISKTGIMTTVKGTLNAQEAVSLDNTLDVTGDTSVSTFDSSGATSLATGGGAVNISKTGVTTTVKGYIKRPRSSIIR